MTAPRGGGRVAYVAWSFPVLTQTFTVREVAALRDRGVPLDVYAAKGPSGASLPALDRQALDERDRTTYLPGPTSAAAVLAFLAWAVRRPLRTLSTLLRSLGGRYRDDPLGNRLRAPLHVLVGAALASRLRKRGDTRRIHAQMLDAGSTAAWAAARWLDLPLSVANHTAYNPFLLEEKLSAADRIVSISAFDRELLRNQSSRPLEDRKIVVSRVGIRIDEWTGLPRRPEPRRVLSVGALREKKGHHVLLRAAAILRERGRPITVVIAGDGAEEASLRALVPAAGTVEMLGAASPDRVRAEMSRASVFCLACVVARNGDLDGIPVALMEAMAAGVPVVSTRVSGIPELVEDGVSGLLAPPADPAALADALDAVLSDADRATALADAARVRVAALHDLRRTSEGLAALLTESLA